MGTVNTAVMTKQDRKQISSLLGADRKQLYSFLGENGWSASYEKPYWRQVDEGSWPLLSKFNGLNDKGAWQEYAAKLVAAKDRLDKIKEIGAFIANLIEHQMKAEFQQITSSAEYQSFGYFVMETYHRESRERYERERKEKADKEAAEQEALRLSRTAIPTEVQVTGDDDYELDTEA